MMQISFSFPPVFVFVNRSVLKYADQSRLRFVVKSICIPVYSFVVVLRCRLTNISVFNVKTRKRGNQIVNWKTRIRVPAVLPVAPPLSENENACNY